MKISIDFLIVNNVPSFYKINLYNELAKHCKIHVVFLALTNQVVNNRSFEDDIQFSYEIISSIQIEDRNRITSTVQLISTIKQYHFRKIIYGGYNDIEQLLCMFLTNKSQNCVQFESSILESRTNGLIRVLKKMIFGRFSVALPSGKLQRAVFETLNFKGYIIETKGVGIFNKTVRFRNLIEKNNLRLNYLFVGRLIPIKNVELLVRVFNKNHKLLTIVGTGILEDSLKKIANDNIKFVGFIQNKDICDFYNTHDVFILPSLSEPWGLVVEEALYYGLPVLISEAVGCKENLVTLPETGIIFSPTDEIGLQNAIEEIENKIDFYIKKNEILDFEKRDNDQIESYLNILEL
jgi:glycosyltransferase involved in cell wall biosynthesis